MPDATFTCPDLTTFCRLDGLTLLSARPLADVAAICGYADQAHLNREFRDLADCTPRELALTFVQDAAVGITEA